jgi:cytochrome c-type biogenesis protein CcmH/NrfF
MTNDPKSLSLWLWVLLAFLLLIGAWTTLIIIAKRNQPQKIELEAPAP